MTLRWLVTGAGGMAGRDVCAALELRGETVLPLTKSDLDIVNAVAVREAV
ncbi:MAG: sugar nucleotide-binding protein, partial [Acidobacteria bacterium]|nr:sugar nucleotide-binding protein [Acidobacteriota bacterium]